MKAGRELDERIHVDVMGLALLPFKKAPCPYCGDEMRYCGERSRCTTCREWRYGPAKEYSKDIAAAWEVWEKLIADNWYPDLTTTYKASEYGLVYGCEIHRGGDGSNDHFWVQVNTAPHAICLAALKAVGVEV